MEVRLFGGIGAWSGGTELDLGGPKQRLVLALLALKVRDVVSLDRIIDVLWGAEPPERAEASVRGYVSNLRRLLGASDSGLTLRWRDGGYVLAGPLDVDVHRFEELAVVGRAHAADGRVDRARAAFASALDLCRGTPFGQHASALGLETTARWDEIRGEVTERLFDVRLSLGEHRESVADLRIAIGEFPFREHLRAQLALALYRSGRPVEALRSIEAARRRLVEEVGVEPGPELRVVEARIHAEDAALAWTAPETADRSGPESPETPAAEFWGRSGELDAVLDVLRELPAGAGSRGRAVVVSGEPGIGKTALVDRVAAHARSIGIPVMWLGCRESAVGAPYWPWLAAASELAASASDLDVGVGRAIVSALDAATRGGDPTLDPPSARLVAHAAVCDALARSSEPWLVVVDDLQWADAASLSLVESIVSDLRSLRLAVAVTVRSGSPDRLVGDCLAELARSAGSTRVELDGLDRPAVAAWTRAALGTAASDDVATVIHERSAGNPFFVREIVALLANRRDGAAVEESAARDLPVAVHDVVRRRTSRLGGEAQRLLVVAAVIGRDVDVDLLARVAGRPLDQVLDLLEPAAEVGLVAFDPDRPSVVRFAHALVVDSLLAELNPIRRAHLHADVVRGIEHRWAGNLDAVLPQLAFHAYAAAAAGGAAASVGYSIRAARAAIDAHTADDAVTHLERALVALDIDDPSDTGRRIEILTELGIARCATADVQDGPAALLAAAELAESTGRTDAVVRALTHLNADDLWTSLDWGQHDIAAIDLIERTLIGLPADDARGRASLLAALAGQTYHVDPCRSSEMATAAFAQAELVGDPVLLFRVLLQQYWAEWRPSGNAARTAIATRMVDLVGAGDLPPRFTPLAHLARFTCAYEVGDAVVSDRQLRLAHATADPVRTPAAWSYVLYARVSTELLRGELDASATSIDELAVAFRRSRRFVAEPTEAGLRMQLSVERGTIDDALAELAVLDASIYGSPIAWFRAWVLAEGGRLAEADEALDAFDGEVADDWLKMPLLTAAVSAAAVTGNVDFLRRHLDALRPMANLIACTGSGGIVVGPVALALAGACRVLGDDDGRVRHLATARALIDRMGAAPWARRADAI